MDQKLGYFGYRKINFKSSNMTNSFFFYQNFFTFPCDIKEQYKIWKNVPRFLLLYLEKIFLCVLSVPCKKTKQNKKKFWLIWANASLLVLYKFRARSRKNFVFHFYDTFTKKTSQYPVSLTQEDNRLWSCSYQVSWPG